MITFRQHVVTIISVFVALAVGVVLGGGPLAEVADTVDRAPQRPATSDKAAGAFSDAFVEESATTLVKDRLDERAVAVVAFPGADEDELTALGELVDQAGGSVSGTYRLGTTLTDPAQKALVDTLGSQLLSQQEEGRVDTAAPTYVRMGQLLGTAVAYPEGEGDETEVTADGRSIQQAMVGADLMADPGEVGDRAPLVLVVLGHGPAADGGDAITQGLVEGLLATSVGTVVAGSMVDGRDDGQLTTLRAAESLADAATVDGVDTPAGRTATVLALSRALSETGGSFGASGSDGTAPLG